MSEFAFTTTVPIRYRDIDPWDHVNNAVFATYMEEARGEYLERAFDDEDLGTRNFVLANLELDYHAPVTYDGSGVEVAVRAAEMGESSLTLAYELGKAGTLAATGETTQVHMGEDGTPAPLPDEWRQSIREFESALE
ncbi:acyl-CoA thioesterase [Halorientalis pallida]|uniref:Acyl-CoA thioesterase n=1 Tax=Halorientalis pallida TaxID=2479928 RepID=A0A498L4T2_9EURY|nr:thioesterase family protein [Halorientalis pallida]RXK50257.1 acyl-CoA thioesterase [Halorientalis pallida]